MRRTLDAVRETQPAVRICLLGRFEILKHGSPILLRPGGKVEQLIGILAMHPRTGMSREALIEVVWPDADSSLAGHLLNSLAHWLKRQLCDALEGRSPVRRSGGRYSLASTSSEPQRIIVFPISRSSQPAGNTC